MRLLFLSIQLFAATYFWTLWRLSSVVPESESGGRVVNTTNHLRFPELLPTRASPTGLRVAMAPVTASYSQGFPTPSVSLKLQPQWIQEYFRWHKQMRSKFPGKELFGDNAEAPQLLIRTCSASEPCGGLHDRLGKLVWDLYLANKTERVLLINWCKPAPLEKFLVPNEIDWSIPDDVDRFFDGPGQCSGRVNAITDFFKNFRSTRPRPSFWEKDLDASLERATTGHFANIKILKSRLLGDETRLRERLKKEGETDMIEWAASTADESNSVPDKDVNKFGQLFWLFFKPSVGLQRELNNVFNELELSPNLYVAAHCRVRHPKAVPVGGLLEAKGPGGGPDKVGLLWKGESRRFAIQMATRALKCAGTALEQQPEQPIYFYSDSEDLVNYVAHQLPDKPVFDTNSSMIESSLVDAAVEEVVREHRVLARPIISETLHIDRQLDHPAEEYYASFVDLLVASRARCVAAGVGNYALFAAQLSDKPCIVQYQGEAWGDEGVKQSVARQCHIEI